MGNKVPNRVSSYIIHFLSTLAKPQRKHFLVYITGLIFMIKFRSIREIAKEFGDNKTDSLHHFLRNPYDKIKEIKKRNKELIAKHLKDVILTIDDTPCKRKGKKIEGSGIHYGSGGIIKGLCAVTAIIKVGTSRFFWDIQGYRTKRTCPKGAFKSKIDIAREIIIDAKRFFRGKLTVLVDAWYACAPVLNPIREAGWTFIAAIKRNRIVKLDGKRTSIGHLAKGPRRYKTIRVSKKKRFKVAKRVIQLKKIGVVLLFISKSKEGTRFIITNDLNMTEFQMVKLYGQRTWIEVFHKEIKQHLGFGEMFMRSWEGVQTHWTLVGIAYNIINLWNGRRPRSFREMIRHFRDSISHDSVIRLPKQLRVAA